MTTYDSLICPPFYMYLKDDLEKLNPSVSIITTYYSSHYVTDNELRMVFIMYCIFSKPNVERVNKIAGKLIITDTWLYCFLVNGTDRHTD